MKWLKKSLVAILTLSMLLIPIRPIAKEVVEVIRVQNLSYDCKCDVTFATLKWIDKERGFYEMDFYATEFLMPSETWNLDIVEGDYMVLIDCWDAEDNFPMGSIANEIHWPHPKGRDHIDIQCGTLPEPA